MSPDWTEMRRLHGQGLLEDTPEPAYGWIEQYIEPEDRAEVAAAISAAISNKSMFDLQHRVRQADGSIGWTRSRAAPIWTGMATSSNGWVLPGTSPRSRRRRSNSAEARRV